MSTRVFDAAAMSRGAAKPPVLFFGIGAQKAGTTWLIQMLRKNRDIHMSPKKEVHYWDSVRSPHLGYGATAARRVTELGRPVWLRRRTDRFLNPERAAERARRERYANIFTAADHRRYCEFVLSGYRGQPVVGEITPTYALLEAETFREISGLASDVRFVFIMRDPVERLWSGVKHRLSRRSADGLFSGQDLASEFHELLKSDRDNNVARSDYRSTITALESVVDPDKVHYIFFETMFTSAAMDSLARFLGVGAIPFEAEKVVHPTAAVSAKPSPEALRLAAEKLGHVYDFAAARFGDRVPPTWRRWLHA